MSLQDRKIKGNTGTGTPAGEHRRNVADAASWTQVVLGGVGVVVAIVAAVFGYFAWIQPHSPSVPTPDAAAPAQLSTKPAPGATAQVSAPETTGAADIVALVTLRPVAGGVNIHADGNDLAMPCATGQSADRQRTVEYDLLRRYTALETELVVAKAPDADSRVQVKFFADGEEVANRTLKKGPASRLTVPVDGTEKLRIQLTCEFPDSEIKLGSPALAHS